MFKKTGDIGRPTNMLAYRLNISFVAKSIRFSYPPDLDAISAHKSVL
jgi:hypothetical protein